ncbi:DUF7167 family protein [Ferviditalea candida]|uniref:DUF7167 domain-containing protein n=1 Tax=Ferviditalea candida TaxID=3108399 RepID=A0ABU5ZFM0_9BACL|nr:hypothetical protein [Paenibacillaceae bacterium T2]
MKVKCKVSIGGTGKTRKAVLEIDDRELEGLTESEQIEVINRYYHEWLWGTIDAEWEAEE